MKCSIVILLLVCSVCFAQDSSTAQPQQEAATNTRSSADEEPPANFTGTVYRIGPSIKPPKAISTVMPEYSEEARRKNIKGRIWLDLVVDEQGVPRNVKVERRFGYGLDEEAVKAVRKWRFEPAKKDGGQPVAVLLKVELNFHPSVKRGDSKDATAH